ncbi:lysine--tRNA ligase [Phytohabitans houttuyneae]|uniref:Lysine--tRNA ligase n=1 Tax=Phytohabitans houttuyneae TaxID=1076126 RepID=A0A6V8KA65_9ACTN|nr:lysine--tRNA ligase [Phytohabitans houttuyneae]GFJ78617.1 lysine--tRNA ligase [Phytohabitans houttuyneae]
MTATLGQPLTHAETPLETEPAAPRPRAPRLPRIFASVLWAVALVAAVAAVVGVFTDVVRDDLGAPLVPIPPNLGYATFVAVLAIATAHRKRLAYAILLAYFTVAATVGAVLLAMPTGRLDNAGIGPGDRVVAAVNGGVALLAVIVLLVARRDFTAQLRPGRPGVAGVVLALLAAVGVVIGYVLVTVSPGDLGGAGQRWAYAAEKVLGGAVVDPGRGARAPGWVDFVLGLLGGLAVLAALWTHRRAQRAEATLPEEDEERVRGLLRRYGDRDSLGYLATRRDHLAAFSLTGKSAVSYRVANGVGLATGDPIGDPEAWRPAVATWLEEADRYGWTPAVTGASEEGATAYARAGLTATFAGDEAILHSGEFTLDGRHMRPVRQAVARVERAGYTASVRRLSEVPEEELEVAAALIRSWGGAGALGRLGDPDDGRCVLVEAYDADDEPQALLSLVPWGAHGLSLDVAASAPDADPGAVEFLVAELMRAAPSLRVDSVSLGVGRYPEAARYQPRWTPRYTCVAKPGDVPKVHRVAAALVVPPVAGASPAVDVEEDAATATDDEPDRCEQARIRLGKRERLIEAGGDPYPAGFPRTDNTVAVTIRHEGLPPDTRTGETAAVAGRIVLMRDHGGVCFVTLRDWTGDLQVMVDEDVEAWRSTVDIGDHVGVRGEVVTSRRGELSVRAEAWQLTAKCLRPLPDKRHGLAGPEARARQRYLDLITSAEARDVLRARSAAIQSLRDTLIDRGYLEVETPVLQRVPAGDAARPFTTRAGAYDLRLYLRVGPGRYLKRLVVGGVERVFELGRSFRNEGVDAKHNPEFTLLSAYQAYADHRTTRMLAQTLVQRAALAAYGSTVAYRPGPNGTPVEYDLTGDWPAVPFYQALSDALGDFVSADTGDSDLRLLAEAAGVESGERVERGALLRAMYERLVAARTTTPTFYVDFPVELSPLARAHPTDERLAERWDLVAYGAEIGTGRSELTDPVEQRRRLAAAAADDPELTEPDEDYLQALEYAMPPTAGLALGADRVVMLLTGRSIRETLPFPLVREARRTLGGRGA